MILSRRGFFHGLVACAAAATCMPALEKALAAVEPMLKTEGVSRLGGAFIDLGSANAMLKEFYSDQRIESLAYEGNPFLSMLPSESQAPTVSEVSQGAVVYWGET